MIRANTSEVVPGRVADDHASPSWWGISVAARCERRQCRRGDRQKRACDEGSPGSDDVSHGVLVAFVRSKGNPRVRRWGDACAQAARDIFAVERAPAADEHQPRHPRLRAPTGPSGTQPQRAADALVDGALLRHRRRARGFPWRAARPAAVRPAARARGARIERLRPPRRSRFRNHPHAAHRAARSRKCRSLPMPSTMECGTSACAASITGRPGPRASSHSRHALARSSLTRSRLLSTTTSAASTCGQQRGAQSRIRPPADISVSASTSETMPSSRSAGLARATWTMPRGSARPLASITIASGGCLRAAPAPRCCARDRPRRCSTRNRWRARSWPRCASGSATRRC